MARLQSVEVQCPYCWQLIDILVDTSIEQVQDYTEDCHVCCQPIAFSVNVDENNLAFVEVTRENA